MLKVNDWVFCHGGLLPHHGQYSTVFLVLFNLILIIVLTSINYNTMCCFKFVERFSDFGSLIIFSSFSEVAYGLERMNKEVSEWMRDPSKNDSTFQLPFIATRGYDSVVWNRLYSRDSPDLMDYEANQVNILGEMYLYTVTNTYETPTPDTILTRIILSDM